MILYAWQTEMDRLVEMYERRRDYTRANIFSRAVTTIVNHAEQYNIKVETEQDVDKFRGLDGVGRTTIELFKEFVVHGKIKRLKNN